MVESPLLTASAQVSLESDLVDGDQARLWRIRPQGVEDYLQLIIKLKIDISN